MMQILGRHPEVEMCDIEPHYFDHCFKKGRQWYQALFRDTEKLTGEKSPGYLYFSRCHKDIYELLPNARLIVSLRNPVNRAYSHWMMKLNDARLFKGFVALHARHPERLKGLGLGAILTAYLQYQSDATFIQMNPFDIIQRGVYVNQLKSLFSYFDRKQVYINIFERLIQDELCHYNKICQFLGISPFAKIPHTHANAGSYTRPFPQDARDRLYQFYHPYNEQLFELLGERVPEWEAECHQNTDKWTV